MRVVSKVRMAEAPDSNPGSSLEKMSLYLRHQPRWRASRARRTDVMSALGVTTELPDLELAVSELVTNAWQHAPEPYELRIFISRAHVKIAVLDGGDDLTQVTQRLIRAAGGIPADGETGRGLQIVTALFPGSCGAGPAVTRTGMTPARQVWITTPWPGPDAPAQARHRAAETR
jgi:histidine kinase-like protein